MKKADSLQTTAFTATNIDTAAYDRLLLKLANGDSGKRWPVKNTVYPLPGAILLYKGSLHYGNLYSKNMGILGELPKEAMLAKLKQECTAGKPPIQA